MVCLFNATIRAVDSSDIVIEGNSTSIGNETNLSESISWPELRLGPGPFLSVILTMSLQCNLRLGFIDYVAVCVVAQILKWRDGHGSGLSFRFTKNHRHANLVSLD